MAFKTEKEIAVIAARMLTNMPKEDMTKAEINIANALVDGGYLVACPAGADDGYILSSKSILMS